MSRARIAVDEVLRIYSEWFGAPSTGTKLSLALQELDRSTAAGEWTRVRVALPEVRARVLVWDGAAVRVAYMERWAEDDGWQWFLVGARHAYKLDGVTHWQALPEKPRGT